MENTTKLIFGDPTPEWYIAEGEGWVGPLRASDVYEKILGNEITWAHFIWRPGQGGWRRVCETDTFRSIVPAEPSKKIKSTVKRIATGNTGKIVRAGGGPLHDEVTKPIQVEGKAAKSAPPKFSELPDARRWFLYYNDTQFGPFAIEEVRGFLRAGKIHGRVHGWIDGMAKWTRLEKIAEFQDYIPQKLGTKDFTIPTALRETKSERRGQPRRPMTARIILSDERSVAVALCRDISVGGMQVLTDRMPGEVGTRIRMNVSPAGGAKTRPAPFVAEGVIVRILEDGRGFSFRFEKISESAKRAIRDSS